ncbi:small nuclear ribonucleoprotein (LSM1), protein [Acrodontium crateriforme]|uniref:U6 snRNA-associated Sm-like protein LSm1 n=1 Tax=Acrodontium crateriforme TaxID=150365 RepID=A0AAQ3RCI8_9PEZI|nr:small nuclear ribonucleoprotein (LSM1), protein [Acrodontium crateriforme]
MENLSLHEGGPHSGLPPGAQHMMPPQGPSAPPPVPQLPPQMFTTAAQLLDLTDKKLIVSLRDGRKFIGVLRSWDQFGNLVLQNTIERLFVGNLYADVERGLFLVRGENVTLLGEIDLDKDDYVPPPYEQASAEKVFELKKEEDMKKKKFDTKRHKKLAQEGFEGEQSGEAII